MAEDGHEVLDDEGVIDERCEENEEQEEVQRSFLKKYIVEHQIDIEI